jgi:hypothetical protein
MDGLTDGVTSGTRGVAECHGRRDNRFRDGERTAGVGESRRYVPWRCTDP